MTFRDYTNQYISNSNFTVKTCKTYSNYAESWLFPILGSLEMTAITPDDALKMNNFMRRKDANEAKQKEVYRFLKRILRKAVQEGIIQVNPCAIQLAWNKDPDFRFPETMEQHLLVVQSIEKIPLRDLFGFCYFTGVSIRKSLTIDLYTVDTNAKILQLSGSPNEGVIYIPKDAQRYVNSAVQKCHSLRQVENHRLFVRADGSHIGITDIVQSTHLMRYLLDDPGFKSRTLCRCYPNILRLTREF